MGKGLAGSTFLLEDGAWLDGDIAVFETERGVSVGQIAWRCSNCGDESDSECEYTDEGEHLCKGGKKQHTRLIKERSCIERL